MVAILIKINVTECDVKVMLAELKEACRRVRKLNMVWKTVTTHRLGEINNLRALEKVSAWRRSHGFDRCDVYDGQWFHSRLPPTPEETAVSMWAELNVLKQEILLSQPPQPPSPQCDVPSRLPSGRSPPPQQCSVQRVFTAEQTAVEEERVEGMGKLLNKIEGCTDEAF